MATTTLQPSIKTIAEQEEDQQFDEAIARSLADTELLEERLRQTAVLNDAILSSHYSSPAPPPASNFVRAAPFDNGAGLALPLL
jgi:hypothetical protein